MLTSVLLTRFRWTGSVSGDSVRRWARLRQQIPSRVADALQGPRDLLGEHPRADHALPEWRQQLAEPFGLLQTDVLPPGEACRVRALLDVLTRVTSLVGEGATLHPATPDQGLGARGELVLGPAAGAVQEGPAAGPQAVQHRGLHRADAARSEHRDVTVAT